MSPEEIIDRQVTALKASIDVWAQELKAELSGQSQERSIGVSYEPRVKLSEVPEEVVVRAGTYRPRHYKTIEPNATEHVRVTQDSDGGTVVFTTPYMKSGDVQMSVQQFQNLYEPIPVAQAGEGTGE